MAKFSISVPDDDWERARAVASNLNASQLVQAALRQLVESQTRKPAFAERPPVDAEGLVDEARHKLSVQARMVFENGYRNGARFANEEELSWGAIDLLADCKWNYGEWLASLRQDYQQQRWFGGVYEYFDSLTEDAGFPPGSVWQMGFVSALKDIWQAVVEDRDASITSSVSDLVKLPENDHVKLPT